LKGIQLLHLHLYTDGRAMVQVLASNMPRSTPPGIDTNRHGQVCDARTADGIKGEFR
jgi:hypothetical protein